MKATKGQPVPIVVRVVDDDGSMVTGLTTIDWSVRKRSDQSLIDSGTCTEMTNHDGIYFDVHTPSLNGDYIIVVEDTDTNFPSDAKHLLVTEEETQVGEIHGKLPSGDIADEDTLTAIKGSGWTGNEDLFNIKQITESSEDTVTHVTHGLSALKVLIDALQTDLDNPNQYKADVSALALEATLTAIKGAGWTTETLKAVKDLIDTLQTTATNIKNKTDTIEWNNIIDIQDEALGKWVLNPVAHTLTLYRQDGVTVLKVFDLTEATGAVPSFKERIPQ
jgi:hypothetical protein